MVIVEPAVVVVSARSRTVGRALGSVRDGGRTFIDRSAMANVSIVQAGV